MDKQKPAEINRIINYQDNNKLLTKTCKTMDFKIEKQKNKKKNIISFQGFNKLSLLLSFTLLFTAFAYPKAYTQNDISFDVENETIISVLDKIELQTPLRFIFGSEIYDFEKTITLTVEKASLNEVIYLIFENKLSYELNENVVILSKTINQSSKKRIRNMFQDI